MFIMQNDAEIYDFYNNGAEIDRLEQGLGAVEFYRSKEIISGYIKEKSVIYDIGGGIGKYSDWLAGMGHDVTLIELAPKAVEYAKANMKAPYLAEVGDARDIRKPDESADVVLLMGPLYHLQDRTEREKALREAYRVLKKGGLLIAAGISRYSTATWALSTYGRDNSFLDDDEYMDMIRREIIHGEHDRPEKYPFFIANSFFHHVNGMEDELKQAGFYVLDTRAVEGCVWITPMLSEKWNDELGRKRLLELIHLTEFEWTVIGMSPHFLTIGKKGVVCDEITEDL